MDVAQLINFREMESGDVDEVGLAVVKVFPKPHSLQRPEIHDSSKRLERREERFISFPPINHCARHWGTLATVAPIHKKFEPSVIKETDGSRFTKDEFFPMPRIGCDRH